MNVVQKQKIAVFDVDWTLLEGTSAESLLFVYMMKHQMIPIKNVLLSMMRLILLLPFGLSKAVLKNRYYFRGISEKEMQACLPDFFETSLKNRLSKPLLDRLEQLKASEYRIILLTGTLDFILQYLMDTLDIEDGISSKLERNEEIYTGHIIGEYPYHRGKLRLLEKTINLDQIDMEASFAFADNWADLPLLRRFGNPVVVQPDFILKAIAKKNGWEIIPRKVEKIFWPVRVWINYFYRP